MYYRIRFKAAPEEFIFETKGRGHNNNTVGDVIRTVREKVMITHETLLLLLGEDRSRVLLETEKIKNSRTYIVVVKRKPSIGKIKHCSNRKKKKRQKVLYQSS